MRVSVLVKANMEVSRRRNREGERERGRGEQKKKEREGGRGRERDSNIKRDGVRSATFISLLHSVGHLVTISEQPLDVTVSIQTVGEVLRGGGQEGRRAASAKLSSPNDVADSAPLLQSSGSGLTPLDTGF